MTSPKVSFPLRHEVNIFKSAEFHKDEIFIEPSIKLKIYKKKQLIVPITSYVSVKDMSRIKLRIKPSHVEMTLSI